MSEMKKKNKTEQDEEALKRLEAIIRSLNAEKKLLGQRLTDANVNALEGRTGDMASGEGKVIEKFFHMPNTGIVFSSQELTPALK